MLATLQDLDLLVICGGFRTELKASEPFIQWLRSAGEAGAPGLWNGSWFLGRAGCCRVTAVPSTPNIARHWPKCPRRRRSPATLRDRPRSPHCVQPLGAFHMALTGSRACMAKPWLKASKISWRSKSRATAASNPPKTCVSSAPREVVKLMDANLEEPLNSINSPSTPAVPAASWNACSKNSWAPRRNATTWNCASLKRDACCSTPSYPRWMCWWRAGLSRRAISANATARISAIALEGEAVGQVAWRV